VADSGALERWSTKVEGPLIVAAVVFLVAYGWVVLARLSGDTALIANIVMWVIWALFLADYIVRVALAPRTWNWIVTHLFDLLIVVLPMFRPLRLLRLVVVWRIVQGVLGRTLRARVAVYVVGSVLALGAITSLAVLEVERDAPGATITNIGQALWWEFATITTVGYGDVTPVTTAGRFIAAAMMIAGVTMLSTLTATFASLLLEKIAERNQESDHVTRLQVSQLADELRELRARLDRDES
jgi:voltage-gated potassium channel